MCGQHDRALTDIVRFHRKWWRTMEDLFVNSTFHKPETPSVPPDLLPMKQSVKSLDRLM